MKMKYARQQIHGMQKRNDMLEHKYSKLLTKYEQILALGKKCGGDDFANEVAAQDLDLDSLIKSTR